MKTIKKNIAKPTKLVADKPKVKGKFVVLSPAQVEADRCKAYAYIL